MNDCSHHHDTCRCVNCKVMIEEMAKFARGEAKPCKVINLSKSSFTIKDGKVRFKPTAEE